MEGVLYGAKTFEYLFHCWQYNHVVILSLCLLAHAYHMAFQFVKKSSLYVDVLFFV